VRSFTMEGITGSSQIMTGGSLANLHELCEWRGTVIISDENVLKLHGAKLPPAPIVSIRAGEASKDLNTVFKIYKQLVELEVGRDWLIIGAGGGVVTDIAGFVASTFLRGIEFGFLPTTLIAQVDAAIGGKNGVNLDGYKNLVGTFNQPSFVICDPTLLSTLPQDELMWGLAEALKAGAIGDALLFEIIEDKSPALLSCDVQAMNEVIERAVAVKVDVVVKDEREAGLRRILNFGHTFGHALEKVDKVPHGAAISVGMVVAAKLSQKRGMLSKEDVTRLESALSNLGLPTKTDTDAGAAMDAIRKDKKRAGKNIAFVLLEEIGKPKVEMISFEELSEVMRDMR